MTDLTSRSILAGCGALAGAVATSLDVASLAERERQFDNAFRRCP
jgi:hypothetical protein